MLKGYKIYSIITGKCPVCHEESMYKVKNPYKFSSILKMNERCSLCNTKYQIEPSFFYGAMYVSYALGVAIATATFVVSFIIVNLSVFSSFMSIIVVLTLLMPVIMRLSRNIWINMFLNYKPASKRKTD